MENQVLFVQERVGPASKQDIWKIPTGLVECGEDISVAAEREVMEEVGIDASFEKIVSMKHMHRAAFGKSDMFFTCILRTDERSNEFTLQRSEIARAKWDTFQSFLNQKPFPSEIPLWREVYQQCLGPTSGIVGDVKGLTTKRMDIRNPLREGDGRPDDAVLIY